jgi:outer membrane protein assembly factor BamD
MRILFSILLITMLAGCGGINKIMKSKDAAYKLRMAEQYFVKKKYAFAQALYEDVMPNYVNSPAEFQDIYYKYAYCAWNQKDYLNAENLFKSFLERFPNSPKAEEMDYMRAFAYYKQSPKAELDQTNTIKTIGMMQAFINNHPGSERIKDANNIIDICRAKMEVKEYKSAQLYYDIGQFRAAGVAFAGLLNNYPESVRADEYKLLVIKSFYRYAELSIDEKKEERYENVIKECNDFIDRFPDSKLLTEAERYITLSTNIIKNSTNEQNKTPA